MNLMGREIVPNVCIMFAMREHQGGWKQHIWTLPSGWIAQTHYQEVMRNVLDLFIFSTRKCKLGWVAPLVGLTKDKGALLNGWTYQLLLGKI